MNLDQLLSLGFDRSRTIESGDGVRIGCSQCEAVAINGVPCHETGCPNETHECDECDALIPKRQRLCDSCAENQQ